MRIVSQSPQQLVVVDSGRWFSIVCACAALAIVVFSIAQNQPNGFLAAALFLFFAMLADYRTTFTFDAIERVVRWKGRKFFKAHSGAIPFGDITDIVVEAISSDGVASYRLAILTAQGSTPMAYAYSGIGNHGRMRATIMAFVHPETQAALSASAIAAPLADNASIRSLLRQGRKVDAVTLLRSTERLNLTQALQRIDAIDKAMKTGK